MFLALSRKQRTVLAEAAWWLYEAVLFVLQAIWSTIVGTSAVVVGFVVAVEIEEATTIRHAALGVMALWLALCVGAVVMWIRRGGGGGESAGRHGARDRVSDSDGLRDADSVSGPGGHDRWDSASDPTFGVVLPARRR